MFNRYRSIFLSFSEDLQKICMRHLHMSGSALDEGEKMEIPEIEASLVSGSVNSVGRRYQI